MQANQVTFPTISQVIAIQNYGTSGTLLMQSLLDSHPQILSIPALRALQLLNFWNRHKNLPNDVILQNFLSEFNDFFEPQHSPDDHGLLTLGPHSNEIACIDKNRFLTLLTLEWQKYPKLTGNLFFNLIYGAYNLAQDKDISQAKYIMYPIHCRKFEEAVILNECFSNIKFLHMVRDPIKNIGSLAKHIAQHERLWHQLNLLSCSTAQVLHDYSIHSGPYPAHGINPYISDTPDQRIQSRAIKLESLHTHPIKCLTALCEWLDIKWHNNLMISTFDAKLWHNRPESLKQSGLGTGTIKQQYQNFLSTFDRYRLRYLAMPIAEEYNYYHRNILSFIHGLIMPILLFFPFKMECKLSRLRSKVHSLHTKGCIELENTSYFMRQYGPKLAKNKALAIIISLYYNMKNYILCRIKWLLPAWKNAFFRREQPFVKLLTD